MSQVRIAVAGAGLIGQRHIEEVDASASAELAAIVDPFPAAAEIAAKFSVPLLRLAGRAVRARTSPTGSSWPRRTSCTWPAAWSAWPPACR